VHRLRELSRLDQVDAVLRVTPRPCWEAAPIDLAELHWQLLRLPRLGGSVPSAEIRDGASERDIELPTFSSLSRKV